MLSETNRSHTFSSLADGYSRGEGVCAVVLKPLSAALRDGDPIRAVIRGSGVNQDGKTAGITMPSAEAQAELIKDTYNAAGLSPLDTQYVEAHVSILSTFLGEIIDQPLGNWNHCW